MKNLMAQTLRLSLNLLDPGAHRKQILRVESENLGRMEKSFSETIARVFFYLLRMREISGLLS